MSKVLQELLLRSRALRAGKVRSNGLRISPEQPDSERRQATRAVRTARLRLVWSSPEQPDAERRQATRAVRTDRLRLVWSIGSSFKEIQDGIPLIEEFLHRGLE